MWQHLEHAEHDPHLELLCCMSSVPVCSTSLAEDLSLPHGHAVRALMREVEARFGFKFENHRMSEKGSHGYTVPSHKRAAVRRECEQYWRTVYG